MRFEIRVKPGAKNDRVGGTWGEDALVVAVKARAVDGAANAAVVKVLADSLNIPKSAVEIVHGHRSRTKLIDVSDSFVAVEDLQRLMSS